MSSPKKALIVWGNWGPYHYARFRGFKKAFNDKGHEAIGLELFPVSGHYEWKVENRDDPDIHHLNLGSDEARFPLWKVITVLLPELKRMKPDYVFVPSYWHWSLCINLFCRLRGARIIMMNETHGGSETARGFKKAVKRFIVSRFHAALVGGIPHKRFFASLGLKEHLIFPGYDAIDNGFFTRAAEAVRKDADAWRKRLRLPNRYFLSLSRMIPKKNLPRLVRAYARVIQKYPDSDISLVFVGSGESEADIRQQVSDCQLEWIDHTRDQVEFDPARPAVHFYGFRQIDENPAFYALSECFMMPSVFEEWGLVCNEAMACSRPAITSEEAGCAEDLIIEGVTGFKVPQEDTRGLAEAMMHFVEDPTLAQRMGSRALEHISRYGCDNLGMNAVSAAMASEGRPL